MRRREFLRYGGAFAAFTAASTSLPSLLAAQTTDPGDAPTGEEADFDLEIVDVDVELIDGSVVPMYAFAHTGKPPTIPGPILRVKQGDTVRIDIRNSSTRSHGFQIMGQDNASISGLEPHEGDGEDKARIEFVATKPGTGRGQKPRQCFICNRYQCSGRVADWLGSLGYSSFLKDS
jgi:FtsP/CotA-like multicopper oxidase with cupredoxin domain